MLRKKNEMTWYNFKNSDNEIQKLSNNKKSQLIINA